MDVTPLFSEKDLAIFLKWKTLFLAETTIMPVLANFKIH